MSRFSHLQDYELRWLYVAMDVEADSEPDDHLRAGKMALQRELEIEMIRRNLSLN